MRGCGVCVGGVKRRGSSLLVECFVLAHSAHDAREHTVLPLVCCLIKGAIQLVIGQGQRVDGVNRHLHHTHTHTHIYIHTSAHALHTGESIGACCGLMLHMQHTFWYRSSPGSSFLSLPSALCSAFHASLLPLPVLPTIILPCLATLQSNT